MTAKDIKKIKIDLGICADTLMSLFIANYISEFLGIIYFIISMIFETVLIIKLNLPNKK